MNLDTNELKSITYKEVEEKYEDEAITEIVLAARGLAWDDYKENLEEVKPFRFRFYYHDLPDSNSETGYKTYHHVVILPECLRSEVNCGMTDDEFNKFMRGKSIYMDTLVKDLSGFCEEEDLIGETLEK